MIAGVVAVILNLLLPHEHGEDTESITSDAAEIIRHDYETGKIEKST